MERPLVARLVAAALLTLLAAASPAAAAPRAWQEPITLGTAASAGPGAAAGALTSGGDAVAAWDEGSPAGLRVAVKPAGGAPPVRALDDRAGRPAVGADRAGGVIVAWRDPAGIRAATRPAGGGAWTRQTVAQPARTTRGLDMAAADAGAVLTWAEARPDATGAVEVAVRQGAGSFGAP